MSDNDSVKEHYGDSVTFCDYILKHQLEEIQPSQIVDFGAGGGKIGKITRLILADHVKLIAVEGCEKTTQMLSNQGLYDEVHYSIIQDWIYKDFNKYDLAIFGDVLEHLTPKEIHMVIGHCLKKFKHIIVICPLHEIFQEELDGNPLEIHQTYVTINFFDRYNFKEKHIVKGGGWNIMNVHILPECGLIPIKRRLVRFVFYLAMLVLQPIGLARPFVNILKRYFSEYIWALRN